MADVEGSGKFVRWSRTWLEFASVRGSSMAGAWDCIDAISDLWSSPIPGPWKRPTVDDRLIRRDYQRIHSGEPRGEALLEQEVLCEPGCQSVLGDVLLDGVNAVPLVRSEIGGKDGNVEADMLLLVGPSRAQPTRQILVEAKVESNNAWYATVEAARQLKLFLESPSHHRIFRSRNRIPGIPGELATASVVVAPRAFYNGARGRGQKPNSVAPAKALCDVMRERHGVSLGLAVWNPRDRNIRSLWPRVG